MRFGLTSQVSAAAARSQARPTEMQELVDAGYLVIGSPDEVAEQIEELADNLHVGNLMLLLQFGNMSKELTKYNTRLFAERVMPKLHGKFAEYEHRWWPKPMDAALRAELPAYAAT
jgi:alkanesulfonate monooxygenase SsuD/methylene tetrahydromethanopterin reductase-like flavin-dependent oxidoreductase (luciferase family)